MSKKCIILAGLVSTFAVATITFPAVTEARGGADRAGNESAVGRHERNAGGRAPGGDVYRGVEGALYRGAGPENPHPEGLASGEAKPDPVGNAIVSGAFTGAIKGSAGGVLSAIGGAVRGAAKGAGQEVVNQAGKEVISHGGPAYGHSGPALRGGLAGGGIGGGGHGGGSGGGGSGGGHGGGSGGGHGGGGRFQ
jgi:hypothetical protein